MNKRNLQKELDAIIKEHMQAGVYPKLLLHACCAPCSSYCLEYLSDFFDITVYYYNPNIDNKEEYKKRVAEEKRLIGELKVKRPINFIEGDYEPERYHALVKGLEKEPEGGERCKLCFKLRLFEAARVAKSLGFDYFTTTLTISPLKDANLLCDIGEKIASEVGISYLPSDFKKKEGYKRSVELSKQYELYRQNYCGCSFSKNNRQSDV